MSSPPLFFSCRPWQETVPILLISSWHQLYFIDLYSFFFVVVVCFIFISSYSLFSLLWIYFSLLLDSWDVSLGEWSEAFPLSLYPVSAMNFFLSAALTLSHKFWYVVLLFSFSLTWYLIFTTSANNRIKHLHKLCFHFFQPKLNFQDQPC